MNLHLILYVIAAVLFAIAALGAPVARFNLVAAGLFCWVITFIV